MSDDEYRIPLKWILWNIDAVARHFQT